MAILNGAELRAGTALTAETGSITNLVVAGNLEVQGTQTIIDSTVVDIADNIISVNGANASAGGLYVNSTSTPGSGSLVYDTSNVGEEKWELSSTNSSSPFARFGVEGGLISGPLTVTGDILNAADGAFYFEKDTQSSLSIGQVGVPGKLNVVGGDISIKGFSSVSASLAALESAPAATLDVVTDAGNTTTNDISVDYVTTRFGRLDYDQNNNFRVLANSGADLNLQTQGDDINLLVGFDNKLTANSNGVSISGSLAIPGFPSVSSSLAALESAPASTLDVVTDAGNTTTNSITVGNLLSSGDITQGSAGAGVVMSGGTIYADGDLSIVGDITGSTLSLDGLATFDASADEEGAFVTLDSRLSVSNRIQTPELRVTSDATIEGNLTLGNPTNGVVVSNGSINGTGYLNVTGAITGSDVQIDGFSSVSASLAALESAPASTLDVVTDAGNTTTNSISVDGLTVNTANASSGGLYVNHTGTIGAGSAIFDGTSWALSAENSMNPFASFGVFGSTIGSSLSIGGPTTVSGSLAIEGIPDVSASLAALESAPASTLDVVTSAGATTTNAITVGGVTSDGIVDISEGGLRVISSYTDLDPAYGDVHSISIGHPMTNLPPNESDWSITLSQPARLIRKYYIIKGFICSRNFNRRRRYCRSKYFKNQLYFNL